MAVHRFYCPVLDAPQVVLGPEESRHAVQVLRLPVGAGVTIFDGCGRVAEGRIAKASRAACTVDVLAIETHPRPAGPRLTLLTALPRGSRQQYLFEKCTELGVARIVPTLFARCTVIPKTSSVPKWRQWTIEAAKQSGCAHLPRVDGPTPFSMTLNAAVDATVRLMGAPTSQAESLRRLRAAFGTDVNVFAWVGPEGGLTEEESAGLRDAGAVPVRLAENVLRVETAAVAFAAAFALP